MYRGTRNAKYKIFDFTGNNWSYWNNNKRLKEKFETISGKHSIDSVQNTAALEASHTKYGKYCSLKIVSKAVGINFVSRAEVLGRKSSNKRRDYDDDDDEDDNNNNNNNNVGFKNTG